MLGVECSAGGQSPAGASISSCHQMVPALLHCHSDLLAGPFRTTTCSMAGSSFQRLVGIGLRGTTEPRRNPPSWVIRTLASASLMRQTETRARIPRKQR